MVLANKGILRTLLLILFALPAFAQQKEITGIAAVYDSNAVAELYSTTPIGLIVTYKDGTERRTAGLLKGDLRWSQVTVETPYGECSNGVLRFNRNRIRPDNYNIRLLVTLRGQPGKQHEVMLQLPYLTGIRFHHYADSLKRGIHFYLNVEGIYNSGRIYPLDTSRIRFTASTGRLIGQDLLIPGTDSSTRFISVNAVYRGNREINAATEIPVKQGPEDESMIIKNEKDVFSKPKKKRN
jgi:hypothetical protein